jgi:aryl-alcohol dehydrogenase-like predicted oxidoreductase
MQNHYNLIYREEEREMIPLCQAEGIGLIPWSPLARGLLAGTRKTPDDKTPTARAASDDFAWKLYDHPADIEVGEVKSFGFSDETGLVFLGNFCSIMRRF